MKKKMILTLFVALFLTTQHIKAETKSSANVEYLENGDRIETVLEEFSYTRNSSTKFGTKTVSYYNESNKLLWSVEIQATFTYGNGTSQAVRAVAFTQAPSPNWKITSRSATKVKNTATAKATAKRYYLGIVMQTVQREVTITCTASGILV